MLATATRQAGLSLIELMIAITIALFLLIGLVSVFATSNQTYLDLGKASQQIENGRFAVQILTDDIGQAGFYGRYAVTPAAIAYPPDPCVNNNAATLKTALYFPVQGYNNAHPGAPLTACLPLANYLAGTDILVVRRIDSNVSAGEGAPAPNPTPANSIIAGALQANYFYLQANADSTATPVLGVGTGVAATDQATFPLKNKDSTSYAPVRRYHLHVYFIAPCSVPADGTSVCTGGGDDNGRPIPTLKRIELTSNGVMSVIPLVEGIENLQFDYGVDSDKDSVPDAAASQDPGSAANWSNVVTVRISVLARNLEPTNGYVDDKTYDMGAAGGYTPNGPYKRHVYNAVARIVNPASRREP